MGPEAVKSAILAIIGILFIILSNVYKVLSLLCSKEEALNDKAMGYNTLAKVTGWIGVIFTLFTILS